VAGTRSVDAIDEEHLVCDDADEAEYEHPPHLHLRREPQCTPTRQDRHHEKRREEVPERVEAQWIECLQRPFHDGEVDPPDEDHGDEPQLRAYSSPRLPPRHTV